MMRKYGVVIAFVWAAVVAMSTLAPDSLLSQQLPKKTPGPVTEVQPSVVKVAAPALVPVPLPAMNTEIKLAPGKWAGTVSGTNKVTVTVDAAGVITAVLAPGTVITIIGVVGTTPPDQPTGLTPFAKAVAVSTTEAIRLGGTATTGAAISAVYGLVGEAVGAGDIAPDNALTAVSAGVRLVLSKQADADKWTAFRQSLGDALDTLRQDGSLRTKEQYAGAFKEITSGMNSVTGYNGSTTAPAQRNDPNAGILDRIDLAKLLELIKFLVELFKTFI